MSEKNHTVPEEKSPPTIEEIEQKLRDEFERIIAFCKEDNEIKSFFSFF